MAILDDLKDLYDNLWDASFTYKGQDCVVLPNSRYDILIIIGNREYVASSYDDLISIHIDGESLPDIMSKIEVQYG